MKRNNECVKQMIWWGKTAFWGAFLNRSWSFGLTRLDKVYFRKIHKFNFKTDAILTGFPFIKIQAWSHSIVAKFNNKLSSFLWLIGLQVFLADFGIKEGHWTILKRREICKAQESNIFYDHQERTKQQLMLLTKQGKKKQRTVIVIM